MNLIKKLNSNLSFMIIGSVIILLVVFAAVIDIIGYRRFTRVYTNEYNDYAYRTALTAAAIIDANQIDHYIETGGEDEGYKKTRDNLFILANKQGVSVIYLVKPDPDYKNFTSVFNAVSDDSPYEPWEIGLRRKTTNEEYEEAFKNMYENGSEREVVIRTRDLEGANPHITSMIPVKDSQGNVTGILCVQRFINDLKKQRIGYMRWIGLTTFILIILTIITASLFLNIQVVRPIKKVTAEAKRFSKDNTINEKPLGEGISKVTEISELADSIDKMEMDTVNNMFNLALVTKENERIGTELHLAALIQENSLPNIFPPFPDRTEFDVYATMDPAKEIGGDFYDFYLTNDHTLTLVMADVSGKGVPGALFMMVTKILIKEHAMLDKSPAEVLDTINDRICGNNNTNMFVTVWLAKMDLRTGNMIVANAGHDDPVIYKNNGEFELKKTKHGMPLGVRKNRQYEEYEIWMGPGDKIFLYTDGVHEATNENGEMYGMERMLASLNEYKEKSLNELLTYVKNDVESFVGEAVQFDDMTMMGMELKEFYSGDNANEEKI